MSGALLSLLLVVSAPRGAEPAAERFVVVVNAANPESSADAETLSAVFLKQRKKWANGEPILPVEHSLLSSLRSAFALAVYGQPAGALQAYWQGEVLAGRDSPPPVLADDLQVLIYVATHVGAIGYVDKDAKLPRTVKVLRFVRS